MHPAYRTVLTSDAVQFDRDVGRLLISHYLASADDGGAKAFNQLTLINTHLKFLRAAIFHIICYSVMNTLALHLALDFRCRYQQLSLLRFKSALCVSKANGKVGRRLIELKLNIINNNYCYCSRRVCVNNTEAHTEDEKTRQICIFSSAHRHRNQSQRVWRMP